MIATLTKLTLRHNVSIGEMVTAVRMALPVAQRASWDATCDGMLSAARPFAALVRAAYVRHGVSVIPTVERFDEELTEGQQLRLFSELG